MTQVFLLFLIQSDKNLFKIRLSKQVRMLHKEQARDSHLFHQLKMNMILHMEKMKVKYIQTILKLHKMEQFLPNKVKLILSSRQTCQKNTLSELKSFEKKKLKKFSQKS